MDAWRKSPRTGSEDLSILLEQDISLDASGFLLPYAPPLDRWTDDHYSLFTLVELALGNRKLLTPEEAEDKKFADDIDVMIESGEPDWLHKVMNHFDDLGDNLDEALLNEIDNDQRRRGQ